VTLDRLDALPAAEAEAELLACCGSRRWAREMAARRPFGGVGALLAAADEVWWSLAPDDWHEAFRAHPRIGERKAAPAQTARAAGWSAQEQSAASSAAAEVAEALAEGNRAYEERFGRVFLICATGLSGADVLGALHARLDNDEETEAGVVAAELRTIALLRLRRVLAP